MAKYLLTNKAVDDLTKIWNYTFEIWSEEQADKYYKQLISSCEFIADNVDKGRNYDGIRDSLLGFKSGKHIIFYRQLNDNIEILRILHERMDLRERIKE